MSVVDKLISENTVEQIEARVLSVMTAVGIAVTAFIVGEPSEQMFQIFALLMKWMSDIIRAANMAQFLDTAYDPGDFDGQLPTKGWLSYKGESEYDTERTENTFATGFETLTNNGSTTHTIKPEQLTFQHVGTGKTYRNAFDLSIYGAARLLTLAPTDSVIVPIRADDAGTTSNATPGTITILQSALAGVDVTNASPVLGTDRQPRGAYIAECKIAGAKTSPNGPAEAYEYISYNTNTDGTLSTIEDGKQKVNVTRVQVTKSSSTGIVSIWLASPSGPAIADDVTAVTTAIAQWATPDCVTVFVYAAIAHNIDVDATLKATSRPGITTGDIIDAATEAETLLFSEIPVGGYDGLLYTDTITAHAIDSHPATYHCTLSDPASNVTIAQGEVAVLVGNSFNAVLT